jgi:hypothetical protein
MNKLATDSAARHLFTRCLHDLESPMFKAKPHPHRWHAGLALVIGLSSNVQAAVTLPGGDFFLNGEFDEIHYGQSGLAYLSLYLYTGELGVSESPVISAATTDLSYAYSYSGFGQSLATISYTIGNEGAQSFNDLRFIVKVQADGSPSFIDNGRTVPAPWGAASVGDPAHFQIADIADGLNFSIVQNDRLLDNNQCNSPCDIDFGLQWNIDKIAPGQAFILTVGLSDNGLALSQRYLVAESVDSPNTVLTFSGNIAAVPTPAAAGLFASGLVALALRRKQFLRAAA